MNHGIHTDYNRSNNHNNYSENNCPDGFVNLAWAERWEEEISALSVKLWQQHWNLTVASDHLKTSTHYLKHSCLQKIIQSLYSRERASTSLLNDKPCYCWLVSLISLLHLPHFHTDILTGDHTCPPLYVISSLENKAKAFTQFWDHIHAVPILSALWLHFLSWSFCSSAYRIFIICFCFFLGGLIQQEFTILTLFLQFLFPLNVSFSQPIFKAAANSLMDTDTQLCNFLKLFPFGLGCKDLSFGLLI